MKNSILPEILLDSNSFNTLTEKELQTIEFKHSIIKYKKGEFIAKQGAFASQIMFVLEGIVKIYVDNQGLKNILSIEPSGTFLGIPALSSSKVYPYSITPIVNSTVCIFDMQDLHSIIVNNGSFASEILIQSNDYLVRCFDRMHNLIHKQIHGRFANIMLCLSERIYNSYEFTLTLSRKDLAELTAMTVESLSRLIKEFRDENIVVIYKNNVKIINLDKLKQIDKTG